VALLYWALHYHIGPFIFRDPHGSEGLRVVYAGSEEQIILIYNNNNIADNVYGAVIMT